MEKEGTFEFSLPVLLYPLIFILILWLVFWVEVTFGYDFNYLGIRPRTLSGLRGILFAPFIHANIKHLFSNTVPLFVLSMALFFFYRKISWQILLLGVFFTGLLTWCFARPATHIGASGLIYVLASFLFFKGIFSKYYRLMALSFIVVFLYGGMIWFVMPTDPSISWEGHLSGLIVGVVFSFFYKQKIEKPPKYEWERKDYNATNDPFMKHFDKDGNFIEQPTDPCLDSRDKIGNEKNEDKMGITYRYFYKSSEDKNT